MTTYGTTRLAYFERVRHAHRHHAAHPGVKQACAHDAGQDLSRLLIVVLSMLIMDSVSRVTANSAPCFPEGLAHFGTLFIFVCDPVGYLFALSYIDSWVSPSRTGSKTRTVVFFICNIYVLVNAVIVIGSQVLGVGCVYSFAPDGTYLRGPLNRRGIDRELTICGTRGKQRRAFAACMVDLDHFKRINDKYGHDAGDQALRLMASLLTQAFGTAYRIGRYGGDEFFIVSQSAIPTLTSPTSLADDFSKRIKRLRQPCDRANETGRHPFRLSFSAGCAVYDPNTDGVGDVNASLDAFTNHIDELMYQEKAAHHAQMAHSNE
jgi:diguanylate cyclase (GGDEF)-like protein